MEHGAAVLPEVLPAGAMWKWLLLQCLLNGTSEKLSKANTRRGSFL